MNFGTLVPIHQENVVHKHLPSTTYDICPATNIKKAPVSTEALFFSRLDKVRASENLSQKLMLSLIMHVSFFFLLLALILLQLAFGQLCTKLLLCLRKFHLQRKEYRSTTLLELLLAQLIRVTWVSTCTLVIERFNR